MLEFEAAPQATSSSGTPWFCEMNEARDDWDCVQDAELARRPKPKRLPGDELEVPEFAPQASIAAESALAEPPPAPAASDAAGLLALPGDLFAVQLIAMGNAGLAEQFIDEHRLEGAMALQLATAGDVFHVVIMGIYDTLADAQAAIDGRPESLAGIKPWIRPLSSIQAGIRAASGAIAATQ